MSVLIEQAVKDQWPIQLNNIMKEIRELKERIHELRTNRDLIDDGGSVSIDELTTACQKLENDANYYRKLMVQHNIKPSNLRD